MTLMIVGTVLTFVVMLVCGFCALRPHGRKAMWMTLKIAGTVLTFVVMLVCGFLAAAGALTLWTDLGSRFHHDEGGMEYYTTRHPVLILGPAAVGFLAPGAVVWYLYKHSWRVSLRTLLIAMTVVAVILGIYFGIYFYTAYSNVSAVAAVILAIYALSL